MYKIEKGLSLRLGRSSNIRDTEITISPDPHTLRRTGLARIQGLVYDQLYSPVGLSRKENEHARMAEELAAELRGMIDTTYVELFVRYLDCLD